MFDLDLKSVTVGVVISALAGGGLYGLYVKTVGQAGMAQANAYGLLMECGSLTSSSDAEEIKAFLSDVQTELPEIEKSDAVVTSVTAAASENNRRIAGLGTPLDICLEGLERQLKRVDRG
jgi:hypothetical protein